MSGVDIELLAQTALHYAATAPGPGAVAVARLLLEAGASTLALTLGGTTALHIAAGMANNGDFLEMASKRHP